jgi:hypothetical protein
MKNKLYNSNEAATVKSNTIITSNTNNNEDNDIHIIQKQYIRMSGKIY